MSQTTEPSKEAFARFLEVFEKACQFEAFNRVTRGWGAFTETECPDQFVIQVHAWLKEKTHG